MLRSGDDAVLSFLIQFDREGAVAPGSHYQASILPLPIAVLSICATITEAHCTELFLGILGMIHVCSIKYELPGLSRKVTENRGAGMKSVLLKGPGEVVFKEGGTG